LIHTSHPQTLPSKIFCDFLINDIGITKDALDLGVRHSLSENAPLPVILWQFGLISIDQYQLILNWKFDN
tara:strand:+ start:773 stop:982 length:210 start_codon:yes stop_codon:yes gene_type:complete